MQQHIILPDNTTKTIQGNEVIDNEGRNIFNEEAVPVIDQPKLQNEIIETKKADIITAEKIEKEL